MTVEQTIQWVLIAASLVGSAAAFIFTNRDRAATTYDSLSNAVKNLSAEVSCLSDELVAERKARRALGDELLIERQKRRRLAIGIGVLIEQLRQAGIEPAWVPELDDDIPL